MKRITMLTEIRIKRRDGNCWKRPKAIPVFSTRVKWKIPGSRGTLSPGDKALRTKNFVS